MPIKAITLVSDFAIKVLNYYKPSVKLILQVLVIDFAIEGLGATTDLVKVVQLVLQIRDMRHIQMLVKLVIIRFFRSFISDVVTYSEQEVMTNEGVNDVDFFLAFV